MSVIFTLPFLFYIIFRLIWSSCFLHILVFPLQKVKALLLQFVIINKQKTSVKAATNSGLEVLMKLNLKSPFLMYIYLILIWVQEPWVCYILTLYLTHTDIHTEWYKKIMDNIFQVLGNNKKFDANASLSLYIHTHTHTHTHVLTKTLPH